MKKILIKIGSFFGWIFAAVLATVFGICVLFILPFDYIKYKRSLYYKTTRKKYEFYAASGANFRIYNEILQNDLPIEYISNPNNASLEAGWFVYGDTLIVPNVFEFEYDEKDGWTYYGEDENEEKRIIMTLEEYIEIEVGEANELAGKNICDKAVILIEADCLEDPELAKDEKRFLIYDNNMTEVLKSFCGDK